MTNGNLASDGVWTYGHDVENRLTSIAGPVSLTLGYDALGRLARLQTGTAVTELLYDGSALIAEYDGVTGALLRRFVHGQGPSAGSGQGVDAPLVMYSGAGTGSKQYYLADERGSVVARTDANGNALGTVAYGPYGEGADPGTTRFGYTGQMALQGTGLYYMKARVYAPSLGRFLEPDPIRFAGGLNLYAYTGGDPINFTDPLGLDEEKNGECPGSKGPVPCTEITVRGSRLRPAPFGVGIGVGFGNSVEQALDDLAERLAMMIMMELRKKEEEDVCVISNPGVPQLGRTGLSGFLKGQFDTFEEAVVAAAINVIVLQNIIRGGPSRLGAINVDRSSAFGIAVSDRFLPGFSISAPFRDFGRGAPLGGAPFDALVVGVPALGSDLAPIDPFGSVQSGVAKSIFVVMEGENGTIVISGNSANSARLECPGGTQ